MRSAVLPSMHAQVGGIQSVTLGDDEARRRGVQKSILERAGPPTFDVCVEMLERGRWRVHADVGQVGVVYMHADATEALCACWHGLHVHADESGWLCMHMRLLVLLLCQLLKHSYVGGLEDDTLIL